MNKIEIKKMGQMVYEETLENGLKVIICPTLKFKNKLCYFQTKYGSLNNEFIPIGSDRMKKYPYGIAHFLEHKIFESEDNENLFSEFQKDGAYVNAATSYEKTYYYFSCTNNFERNLIRLIDMVQSPYFTNENVEKEKGIIGQEIDMYQNDIDQVIYEKLNYNTFVKSPIKYSIAGRKSDIKKITKDDLYECYNTFYQPSNMFILIVGDVDVNKTIDIIKENQKSKSFKEKYDIIQKEINENEEVFKKEEIMEKNIAYKKLGFSYKIKLEKLDYIDDYKRNRFISLFLRTKFGELSMFSEYLIKNKIVKSYFDYNINYANDYLIITFFADAIEEDKLINILNEKLNNKEDLEKYFDLFKKSMLASYVKIFENPSSICSHIRAIYGKYGKIIDNCYDMACSISFIEYYNCIKNFNFSLSSKVIVNKKEKKIC